MSEVRQAGEVAERLKGQRFTSVQVCEAAVLQLPGAQSLDCFGAVAVYFDRDAVLLRSGLRQGRPTLAELHNGCQRRFNIDPPCRTNIDPGRVAGV